MRLRPRRVSFNARCFSLRLEVSGPAHAVQALGPGTLGQIGTGSNPHRRSSLLSGRTGWTACSFFLAQSWDVFGAASIPDELDLSAVTLGRAGPHDDYFGSGTSGWCAFIFANTPPIPSSPFRGIGRRALIQAASLAGRLSAETSKRSLSVTNLSGPVGSTSADWIVMAPIRAVAALKGRHPQPSRLVWHLVERLSDWATGGGGCTVPRWGE